MDARSSTIRCYLIYVVLDTSESMRRPNPRSGSTRHDPRNTPLGQFVRLIPRMLRDLADNPIINNVAAVSLVAFNDAPEILRPMSSLRHAVNIAAPRVGYATDYAAVLRFMVDQYPRDVREVCLERQRADYVVQTARPWVFFITDGRPYADGADQPAEEWLTHRKQLVEGEIRARVVAIGLPGADEDVLWRLATGNEREMRNAFIASRRTDPGELARSVVEAIGRSISASTRSGTLTISPPAGMRRIVRSAHG